MNRLWKFAVPIHLIWPMHLNPTTRTQSPIFSALSMIVIVARRPSSLALELRTLRALSDLRRLLVLPRDDGASLTSSGMTTMPQFVAAWKRLNRPRTTPACSPTARSSSIPTEKIPGWDVGSLPVQLSGR